jgi:hypothetical protein
MNGSSAGAAAHLDDGVLVQLLDGEQCAGEQKRWSAHVAECARCAAALAQLRDDAATVRGWLDRAAFEDALPPAAVTVHGAAVVPAHAGLQADCAVPDRTGSWGSVDRTMPRAPRRWQDTAPWLRAAAILLLIAAPVAAIPAVREYVTGAIAELRGVPHHTIPASQPVRSAPSTIRFQPAGGEFLVRVDAAQATGTLRILPAAGREAVLVIDDGGVAGPVIAADAVHLRNAAAATGSYVLYLPPTVTRVTVLIGGRTAAVLPASSLTAVVELPLR